MFRHRLNLFGLLFATLIGGCGGHGGCQFDMCHGMPLEITERDFDTDELQFTIKGKVDGNNLSYSFDLQEEETFMSLSFGVQDAWAYDGYGAVKMVDFLQENALDAYYENYVIPEKDCPASFMNTNLRNLVLIGATDGIHERLTTFDIPFDGLGTDFELEGHRMKYASGRYMFNGKNKKGQKILESIQISSNVGSATRKAVYFLVTAID